LCNGGISHFFVNDPLSLFGLFLLSLLEASSPFGWTKEMLDWGFNTTVEWEKSIFLLLLLICLLFFSIDTTNI